MKILVSDGEKVAKRAMFLAWQASGVFGMGSLQDRGPSMTEEDVWTNIQTAGDYPTKINSRSNEAFADYVFGRMMKVGFQYGPDYISWHDKIEPRPSYQSWCLKYPSIHILVNAALDDLGMSSVDI